MRRKKVTLSETICFFPLRLIYLLFKNLQLSDYMTLVFYKMYENLCILNMKDLHHRENP
jgi:hypothetical protein